jgi:NAD(P)-dependent dehydrogenase (short-subunit alcohol dehydrogenase family)
MQLAGRIALVTGSSSGIGKATALRLAREGCDVCVSYHADEVGAQDTVRRVAGLTRRAVSVRADVARVQDIDGLVGRCVGELGGLDIMVNNAAVMGATGSIANLVLADVDRTVAVILGGAVLGMKYATRVMLPQRRGVILTVSSPAGVVGGVGPHAYSAAKAAVLGLTRSVAAELRPHGIRVNAIIPGAIVTAMTAAIVTGDPHDLEGAAAALGADAPIGRPGYPSDIAAAAAFLASDDAAFITGHAMAVDAGYTTIAGPSPFATGEHAEAGMMLGPVRR